MGGPVVSQFSVVVAGSDAEWPAFLNFQLS